MSRVGKQPVKVASGVSVTLEPSSIKVSGASGSLEQFNLPQVSVKQEGDELIVSRSSDEAIARSNHGLMRSLLYNMVIGVSQGFSRQLEIHGVGYRANLNGQDIKLSLGLSHEVTYRLPEGVTAQIDQNVITIKGASKQLVGQVAAEIRALKKPEPYKGKGIRYAGEKIIRKSGKSGKEK